MRAGTHARRHAGTHARRHACTGGCGTYVATHLLVFMLKLSMKCCEQVAVVNVDREILAQAFHFVPPFSSLPLYAKPERMQLPSCNEDIMIGSINIKASERGYQYFCCGDLVCRYPSDMGN